MRTFARPLAVIALLVAGLWAGAASGIGEPAVHHEVTGGAYSEFTGWYNGTTPPVVRLVRDAGTETRWQVNGGPEQSSTATTATVTLVQGVNTITYAAYADGVSPSATQSLELKLDTVMPRPFATLDGTSVEPTDNAVYIGSVTMARGATDDGSGLASLDWFRDILHAGPGEEYRSDTAPYTYTTPGEYGLDVRASDVAGNVWSRTYYFKLFAEGADTVPPTTTVTYYPAPSAGWFSAAEVEVRQSSIDTMTGVKERRYRMPGGPWTSYVQTTPPLVTTEGDTPVEVSAIDWAGNVEPTKTVVVRIDRTKPVLSFAIDEPAVGTATVSFSATDPASGVASVIYYLDYGTPVFCSATGTTTIPVPQPGVHHVQVLVTDRVGNYEWTERTVTVHGSARIDIQVPTATPAYGAAVGVRGRLVVVGYSVPPGALVRIDELGPAGAWRQAAPLAATGADGSFTATLRPTRATTYRAMLLVEGLDLDAIPSFRITPAAPLSFTAPATARKRVRFTVSGQTAPGTSFVVIDRFVRSGSRLIPFGGVYAPVDARGAYRAQVALAGGTWILRARRPRDASFAETRSTDRRVIVR